MRRGRAVPETVELLEGGFAPPIVDHGAWVLAGNCLRLDAQVLRPQAEPGPPGEIGDREDLSYEDKLAAYRRLSDEYFEADRYQEFCASRLGHVDELVLDWVSSTDFDRLLVSTVRATYPAHEHERFVAHLRGLVGQWVRENGAQAAWA